MQFHCTKCNVFIEHNGFKKEYHSPIYGPCFKYIAICPTCKQEIDEYRIYGRKENVCESLHSCNNRCCYN